MFVHTVFFKFKDLEDAPEAKQRLESMRGRVPALKHIEVGLDCLHTARSWHMVLDTRFADQAGYESYATDPVHQEVLAWLKQVVAASATVDYETDT